MEKRYCRTCGCEIPEGRLKAIPNTAYCTAHSKTEKVGGFMSWEHKTTPTLNIVDADTAEEVRKKTARHGQSPIRGIRMTGH